jgi:AcrR family transcriptional regulator
MGATESAVCEHAGVNLGLPFRHWPDKACLRKVKLSAAVLRFSY